MLVLTIEHVILAFNAHTSSCSNFKQLPAKKVRKKKPLEFGSTSFVKTVECCLFFFSFPWLNVACFFLGFPWLNVVCFFFWVFHYLRVQQHSESTYIYRYTYKETHTHKHTHISIYILNLHTKLDTLFSNIYWPFAYPSQGYWCLDSL
jgi:hypothetical protein